jgi:predicted kinase
VTLVVVSGLPGTGKSSVATARVMAEQNLALGRSVVVDAVNDSEPAGDTWRAAAGRTGARLVFVVLTLDDATEHRRRLASRARALTHVPEPTWAQVRARAETLEPWADDAWQVDAGAPVEAIVAEVEERLSGRR